MLWLRCRYQDARESERYLLNVAQVIRFDRVPGGGAWIATDVQGNPHMAMDDDQPLITNLVTP